MRRFELKDDTSKKFWQIELAGKTHTVTFGRIGTEGQSKTKTFASTAAARSDHDKLVSEKSKKGYLEIGVAPPSAPPQKVRSAAPNKLSSALERAKAWMKKHAPLLVENLAKGASPSRLAALEKAHEIQLPADLRALWLIHDGQHDELNGFIGSLDLLDAESATRRREDILPSIRFLREHAEDWKEAGVTKREITSNAWLPFANRDSDWLVVSCETGRVFHCLKDAPPLNLAAPSVADFFEAYASDIESGRYEVEDGFGDYYLAEITAHEREDREARELEGKGLPPFLEALRRELGAFGQIEAWLPATDRGGYHVSVMRDVSSDRTRFLRRALEANAQTLLTRHLVRGSQLISTTLLPKAAPSQSWLMTILKRELEAIANFDIPLVGGWKPQTIDETVRASLSQGGTCLELTKSGAFWQIEGEWPTCGAAVSQTLQMRAFVPIRLPSTESALETLNEMNAAIEADSARVFAFRNQLGVAGGSFLGGPSPGSLAEGAYWDVRKLTSLLLAHGRPPEMSPTLDAELTKRAKECLSALGA